MKTAERRRAAPTPLVALTTGEPAGIGPDLSLMLAARRGAWRGARLVLVGDADLLAARARRLKLALRLVENIYRAGLLGLQRQLDWSLINIAVVTLRTAGAAHRRHVR